jgi:hypothetical protein
MRSPWTFLALVAAIPFTLNLVACDPGNSGEGEGEGEGEPAGPATCTINGVELVKPTEHATADDATEIDMSCVDNPQTLAASESITVYGCVDIFGLGGKAKPGLKIAFFDVAQDPQNDTPAYGAFDIAVKAEGSEQAAACSKEGWYTADGVPTNKPLTVKVYDTATGAAQTAIPTYSYWVYMPSDKTFDGADSADDDCADGSTCYKYEANLVYKTTYDSIPTLGGKRIDGQQVIYDGEGRAVIAGEVKDCKGSLIENVAVSSNLYDASTKLAYFDGDEEDPTPDLARETTNFDALYVVLNAVTDDGNNNHEITTAILDPECTEDDLADCECVSFGGARVQAFPDSVTIMSPEGTFPTAG